MKQLFVIFMILLAMSFDAKSEDKRFGVGVMLGEPTGLSFQSRAERAMYDFGLSWDFDEELTMIADYKIRFHQFQAGTSAYAGVGIFFDYYDHDHHHKHHHHDHDYLEAGVRAPIGVEHLFATAPFGIFGELAPSLELVEEVDLGLMGAIGGRYYF